MDKKEIIEITLNMVKEKKLEKTSIGEILRKINKSPGLLYYYFKNKKEIYKETIKYSNLEIIKKLNEVVLNEDVQLYLYGLTECLIRFFEKRSDILFFLISIKSSYYLDKELDSLDFLENYKKVLLTNKNKREKARELFKLQLFIGAIYEVLYKSKIIEDRNLNDQEIKEICEYFWHERLKKDAGKIEKYIEDTYAS